MKRFLAAFALLALAACSEQQAAQAACDREATRSIAWSSAEATDMVVARSQGPTCAQAIVTLTVRNAAGDPLLAFSSTYFEMTAGGPPPGAQSTVEPSQIDSFLAGWAEPTMSRSGSLPEWREDAATLTQSAETFAYVTPFDRDVYEALRARNLPMLCFAAAVEGTRCLIIDPADNMPTEIVAYGP